MSSKELDTGFTLVEVMVAVVILGLITAPFLNMFFGSALITKRSWEGTRAIHLAGAKMETYLADPDGVVEVSDNSYENYPEFNYNVEVIEGYEGLNLKKVRVEVYPFEDSSQAVSLTTLIWDGGA